MSHVLTAAGSRKARTRQPPCRKTLADFGLESTISHSSGRNAAPDPLVLTVSRHTSAAGAGSEKK